MCLAQIETSSKRQDRKKSEVRLSKASVNFALGQVKIDVWCSGKQVKLASLVM